MMLCWWCFFAMHGECCFSGDETVEGRVVDEDDDCLKCDDFYDDVYWCFFAMHGDVYMI